MEIPKSTFTTLLRYMRDAADFYRQAGTKPKHHDRARLLANMIKKLQKQIPQQ